MEKLMDTSMENKALVPTTKKTGSARRVPVSRLVARKEQLMKLGKNIAEVDEEIEVEKTEISNLKKSKTSEYVMKAREENLNFLILQRKGLISQFEKENSILAKAISRNTSLI